MQVFMSHERVERFKRQYPCSGIPELSGITFEFDSNGDLCDIIALDWEDGQRTDSADFDGPALLALSQDAYKHGMKVEAQQAQRREARRTERLYQQARRDYDRS